MKHILSLVLVINLFISATLPDAYAAMIYATDVKGHWAENYINRLILAGTVSGYPDGSFKPDGTINADEFIVLMLKNKGEEVKPSENGYWAEGIIEKAKNSGILNGVYIESFNAPITREEVSAVVMNAFNINAEEKGLYNFSDVSDIDARYVNALTALVNAGIISGYENNTLKPKDTLTRAEACTIIEKALDYEPEKEEFTEELYDIKDMINGGETPFTIYTAPRTNGTISSYKEVTEKQDGTYSIFSESGTIKRAAIYWKLEDVEHGAMIIPEKDESSSGNRGDVIICFTAPKSSSYRFDLSVKNIGTDVYGGGGAFKYTFAEPEDTLDAAIVDNQPIGASTDNPKKLTNTQVIKLKKNEKIYLRFTCDTDGYGNRFLAQYKVTTTLEEGKKYYNYGLKSYLPQPPTEQEFAGEPFEKNKVWMAVSGYWEKADKELLQESIDVWKKYIPNIGAIMLKAFPEQTSKAKLFKENGIPVMTQSYGAQEIYNYYTATDAWEYDWNGRGLFPGSGIPLQNTGHAAAQPHESTIEAHERMIVSAARSGYSGYGYMDFVWAYGLGSGHSGYNPQTIAAFRRALKGEDEGLKITLDGGEAVLWHFDDFAKFYVGAIPDSKYYGAENWDDFEFLTYSEYQKDTKKDWTPYNLLFDLLVHYEWLRAAQNFGDTAENNDVTAQVLTNSEDMGNGNDTLFLSGLDSVGMHTEQYMGARCVEGAYYRRNYLTSNVSDDKSFGVVVEGGYGGNMGSYFDNESSYANTYELGCDPDVTHLELDFWVQNQNPISVNAEKTLGNKKRYQVLLTSAIAFNHAKEDNLSRIEPDFISITARRQQRPWAREFKAWAWFLGWRGSPEAMLANKGYNFESIGEEGIQALKPGQKVVLYSPEYASQYHFDKLLSMLESGDVANVITNGVALEKIVTYDYNFKKMEEVYPDYSVKSIGDNNICGALTDSDGNIITENCNLSGEYFEKDDNVILMLGETPVAVEKQVGKGTMYTVLFDPDDDANYDLAAAVYGYIFDKIGIKRYWETASIDTDYTDGRSLRTVDQVKEATGNFDPTQNREQEATVRIYKGDELMAVSVVNPMERYFCNAPDMPEGKTYPYKLDGNTDVRVRLSPNMTYSYVAMPSGRRGEVATDSDGFGNFSLINTSHEIFYLMPKTAENEARLSEIGARRLDLASVLTVGGNIQIEDKCAPATVVSLSGSEFDGKYKKATVTLISKDNEYGSGIKQLTYSVDGVKKSVVNRSRIESDSIKETVTLNNRGEHIIEYSAIDGNGNIEETGSITIIVE